MTDDRPFSTDIHRAQESEVRAAAARVATEGQSRALLLYGPGGVGKTRMVRNLAHAGVSDPAVVWLDPIDVDDPEYWLLSNLEQAIALQLEPDGGPYFREYLEHLSRLPLSRHGVGRETVQSQLRRIDRTFADCYTAFVLAHGKVVVLVLDTVEVIRPSSYILTLSRWMKQLPQTLFVLCGRPWPDDTDRPDPLRAELDDPHAPLPFGTLELGGFERDEAFRYLENSSLTGDLDDDEQQKIVHLTRGHPLWLALTVRYLATVGVPEEVADNDIDQIRRDLPYGKKPTVAGERLHEEYRRRLVAPYRSTDFWPEAVKRLAVIRQNLSMRMFCNLMSDRGLPDDAGSWEEAWQRLLDTAWVRSRANRHAVTLHDALAEELARRIIPLHDRDGAWRRHLWRWATQVYSVMVDEPARWLARDTAELQREMEEISSGRAADARVERSVAGRQARLKVRKHELDLLATARLHYRMLTDHTDGVQYFLELESRARKQQDLLFRELLCLEMQQFLPDGGETGRPYDLADAQIGVIRRWLEGTGVAAHLDIGLVIAEYLVDNEQSEAAVALLERLPTDRGDVEQRYAANILMGNALLRIPQRVGDVERYLTTAREEAKALPDGRRRQAEALKELGFYFRNLGQWNRADESYAAAHGLIEHVDPVHGAPKDIEELASIFTNWAYVRALHGRYGPARQLIDDAVEIRRRLGVGHALGLSLSVRGEILRYEEEFKQAWESYEEAVSLFEEPRSSLWLGLLYQEQAICLFQAAQLEIEVVPNAMSKAERLIISALDICRDHAIRHYPSALNRAGRIIGDREPDRALSYLAEGVEEARRLSDAWFHVSNLVEAMELGFRTWRRTDDIRYFEEAVHRMGMADHLLDNDNYGFPGLRGRCELIRAHIAVLDGQDPTNVEILNRALDYYGRGLSEIARNSPGAHGARIVAQAFASFRSYFEDLDATTRGHWHDELRDRWSTESRRPFTRGLLALLADLQ